MKITSTLRNFVMAIFAASFVLLTASSGFADYDYEAEYIEVETNYFLGMPEGILKGMRFFQQTSIGNFDGLLRKHCQCPGKKKPKILFFDSGDGQILEICGSSVCDEEKSARIWDLIVAKERADIVRSRIVKEKLNLAILKCEIEAIKSGMEVPLDYESPENRSIEKYIDENKENIIDFACIRQKIFVFFEGKEREVLKPVY